MIHFFKSPIEKNDKIYNLTNNIGAARTTKNMFQGMKKHPMQKFKDMKGTSSTSQIPKVDSLSNDVFLGNQAYPRVSSGNIPTINKTNSSLGMQNKKNEKGLPDFGGNVPNV